MSTAVKRKADDAAKTDTKKPKVNGSITAFFGAPKSSPPKSSPSTAGEVDTGSKGAAGAAAGDKSLTIPAVAPPPVPLKKPFDRAAWEAKLTDEQRELLRLELETLHESWLPHLRDVLESKEFLDLKRFLKNELAAGKKVFPPLEDVYSWSRHTPLNTVKAVILGQDPYHNINQAHGLCFSVRPPIPAPPSLKNVYIALQKDYPDFRPPPNNGGLLTPWADRGVLLLNTCLTVRAHEANSHANRGWEKLTQKVIDTVNKERRNGVVFLAWGSPAQKRVAGIGTGASARHLVLKSVHPSPLSAARGFFECGHFKKANEWLKLKYGEDGPIDWNLNVDPAEAGI